MERCFGVGPDGPELLMAAIRGVILFGQPAVMTGRYPMLDCILQNLPLILLGIAIILLGFILAAVAVVWLSGEPVSGAAFAAAVAAVLVEWWLPITASILGSLALAFSLCANRDVTPVASFILIPSATTAVTVVSLSWVFARRERRA